MKRKEIRSLRGARGYQERLDAVSQVRGGVWWPESTICSPETKKGTAILTLIG
jgi:hypothetical protein